MSCHWEDLQALTKEVSRFKSSNSLLGALTSTPQTSEAHFIDEETEASEEVAEQA